MLSNVMVQQAISERTGGDQDGKWNKVKVAISYQDERDRDTIQEFIKGRFSGTKVKETGLKNGYLHTVLTVPKARNTK